MNFNLRTTFDVDLSNPTYIKVNQDTIYPVQSYCPDTSVFQFFLSFILVLVLSVQFDFSFSCGGIFVLVSVL